MHLFFNYVKLPLSAWILGSIEPDLLLPKVINQDDTAINMGLLFL